MAFHVESRVFLVQCLLGNLRDLTEVTCNQLLLESIEAVGLLDMLVITCGHSLTRLEILNSTKTRYPLFYAGMLPRLRTLVITPLQVCNARRDWLLDIWMTPVGIGLYRENAIHLCTVCHLAFITTSGALRSRHRERV